MKRFQIVGIDTPCVDLGLNLERFPVPNQGEEIQALSWQGGGKVSSGMVAAARLGAVCAMLGTVGDDSYGQFCIADFQRHGIDTSGMLLRQGCTTNLSVVVSDRETMGRSILHRRGTAPMYRTEELDRTVLTDCDWLFICNCLPETMGAVKTAREAGARVLIDADGYAPDLMEQIGSIDAFIASEFVYDSLFSNRHYEENCRSLMQKGPSLVMFTFGSEGCVGCGEQGFFHIPAFPVEVVDTVGAGDVFHGALLAGLLRGLGAKESARLASAVSAIKCTRIGGRAGIPDWNTTLHFLEMGEIDYTEIDERVAFYGRKLQV